MAISSQLEADRNQIVGPTALPLSVEPYVSKDFYERFIKGVFRKTWINVGRVEEVPNNGDFIVKRIPSVDSGILVIRGKDGVIRAMHNVCPHRGNELVWDDRGTCKRTLTCRFHGWAFSPDGKLAHLTDPEAFPGLDPKTISLTPMHLDTWRGFIFVWIDGQPEQDLATYLGDFGELFAPYPFEKFQLHTRYDIKIKANWMVVMDAFQEAYHARYLHSDFVPSAQDSKLLDYVLEGPHRRGTFSDTVYNEKAPKPKESTIAAEVMKFAMSNGSGRMVRQPTPGFNRKNFNNAFFDANVIFPNFGVHASSSSYLAFRYWPDEYNRTTFEFNVYNMAPTNYAEAISTAYQRLFTIAITAEDLSTLERTQAALESGGLKHLQVGDEEILIRHNHKMVTDSVSKSARGVK